MRVAVVGAGIMGAASAFYLAQMGVDVHLFEVGSRPAEGVTRNAFGWINTINGDPGSEESYGLRVRAVDEYRSVVSTMPELAAVIRRGSLVWKATPEQTTSTASLHARDLNFALISEKAVAAKEPGLLKLPSLAIYSPDDIAVSPSALVEAFLTRAKHSGANVHLRTGVVQIRCESGTVQGLQTPAGFLAFDVVILATGGAIDGLLQGAGFAFGVQMSPIVLLRYQSNQKFLTNIISCPELEVRQAVDGSVLVVAEFYPGCEEENFSKLRNRASTVMNEYLRLPDDITFQSGVVGQRPMLSNGLPGRGFTKEVRGLYCLVGHPGVILAPLLGREAAEEITRAA